MSVLSIDFGETLTQGNVLLRLPKMTSEEFWEFCERNPDLRAERNAEGAIVLMEPGDSFGGSVNAEIVTDLTLWNRQLPVPGRVFDSSSGFTLPSDSVRAPDAAWIPAERWNALPDTDRRRFARICPDFVIELMSPTDRLSAAQEKMREWLENGVRLGWLIDRANRRVYVYRPNRAVAVLDNPAHVSGDPELPGFSLPTSRIFVV